MGGRADGSQKRGGQANGWRRADGARIGQTSGGLGGQQGLGFTGGRIEEGVGKGV